jgi:hypothetical protein
MNEFFDWLLSTQTIILFIYAFLLGWMLRTRYKDILYFFQDNWVPIFCVGFFIALPYSCLALFFVNLYIWQIDLLAWLLLGIGLAPMPVFIWIMRTGNEVKPK